ncbi:hypothetical protein [Delftia tsuruhatensis]|uniref:hypothetical protein n=1 Tax=Delftia tsuruhatensis TaxID=180282 RepID=UPI0028A5AE6E|nr:hypothetical protein [Delftia tsuruhatensis]
MNQKKRQLLLAISFLSIYLSSWAKEIPHQIWNQLKELRGIPTQSDLSQPTLYVFIDPNCPVCADLWKKQVNGKPFNELPAMWLPISHMGNGSLGKAAELLRSGRKEDMQRNFMKFNRSKRQGGLPGVTPTSAERAALAAAKALWTELGGATPMFLYRTKQGEARLFLGLPPEPRFADLVASMLLPSTSP